MRVAAGAVARKVIPGVDDPRRAGADRPAQDRPRALELGRGRQQPLLLARRRHRRHLDALPRRGAQGRLLGRRRDRGRGRGRAGRLGRADLRQARPGPGRRHDEHQCGQGRRDRRRHGARPSSPARTTPTRSASATTARRCSSPTTPAASSAASPSGQPIVVRFAVKPTSSILTPRRTIDRFGNDTEISTKGRHDPCVGIRAVPVGEAMMALVLADHFLRHRAQVGSQDVSARRLAGGSPQAPPYSYRADPAVPAFPDDKALVVFDGVCVLCSGFARFILKRDRGLRLPPDDGAIAARPGALPPLRPRHRGRSRPTSCIADGRAYAKLDSVAVTGERLGGPWRAARAAAPAARARSPTGSMIASRATDMPCSAAPRAA